MINSHIISIVKAQLKQMRLYLVENQLFKRHDFAYLYDTETLLLREFIVVSHLLDLME